MRFVPFLFLICSFAFSQDSGTKPCVWARSHRETAVRHERKACVPLPQTVSVPLPDPVAPLPSGALVYRFCCDTQDGVWTNHSYGGAFPIAQHRLLTAAHILKQDGEIKVDVGGTFERCSLVKIDPALDIALVDCPTIKFTPVPISEAKWDSAQVHGFKFAGPMTTYDVTPLESGFAMCTTEFNNGDSGGILISGGECRGIVLGFVKIGGHRVQQIYYADARQINRFLAPEIEEQRAQIVELKE